MDNRYIIVIWHQAGQRDNSKLYYTLNDDNDCAFVFASENEAKEFWDKHNFDSVHAGFIVNATTSEVDWI